MLIKLTDVSPNWFLPWEAIHLNLVKCLIMQTCVNKFSSINSICPNEVSITSQSLSFLFQSRGSLCNHANDYAKSRKSCKKYIYCDKDGLLYQHVFESWCGLKPSRSGLTRLWRRMVSGTQMREWRHAKAGRFVRAKSQLARNFCQFNSRELIVCDFSGCFMTKSSNNKY